MATGSPRCVQAKKNAQRADGVPGRAMTLGYPGIFFRLGGSRWQREASEGTRLGRGGGDGDGDGGVVGVEASGGRSVKSDCG